MLRSSKHKAAAEKFLEFLVSKMGQEIIAALDQLRVPHRLRCPDRSARDAVRTAAAVPDRHRRARNRVRGDSALARGAAPLRAVRCARARARAGCRDRDGLGSSPCSRHAPAARPNRQPASARAAHRRAVALTVASLLVVAVLALPLAFLLTEAAGAGAANVWHLIWRSLTASLLWNTLRLTFSVHRALCGHRHARRLRRRAHRSSRSAHLGRAGHRALRHPGLRRELRLVLAVDLGAGLQGSGARHDPRRVSPRLPARGGQPARCRSLVRRRSPAASARAGSPPSSASRWARPAGPSSAGACSSRSSSSPSTAPSRSSATRRSRPRYSPPTTVGFDLQVACALSLLLVLLSLVVLVGEGARWAAGAG